VSEDVFDKTMLAIIQGHYMGQCSQYVVTGVGWSDLMDWQGLEPRTALDSLLPHPVSGARMEERPL
jgi:hypothetical protein